MLQFVIDHQNVIFGIVGMGLADLAVALNSKLASNGIFHAFYLFCSSKKPVV